MTDTLRQMFRDSDMFNRDSYIRNKLEKFSKWAEAAECWAYIGRKSDADACKLLAESCAKGDAYREAIKQGFEYAIFDGYRNIPTEVA